MDGQSNLLRQLKGTKRTDHIKNEESILFSSGARKFNETNLTVIAITL